MCADTVCVNLLVTLQLCASLFARNVGQASQQLSLSLSLFLLILSLPLSLSLPFAFSLFAASCSVN